MSTGLCVLVGASVRLDSFSFDSYQYVLVCCPQPKPSLVQSFDHTDIKFIVEHHHIELMKMCYKTES